MKRRSILFLIIAVSILGLSLGCTLNSRPDHEASPISNVTITPIDPTVLPFPTLTGIPTNLPTDVKTTASPFPEDSDFYRDLLDQGYSLLESSSVIGPGDYTYSAYLFLDAMFPVIAKSDNDENAGYALPSREVSVDELETAAGCKIVFYRSGGQNNELLYAYDAPKYPEGNDYNHYPVSCVPASWNMTTDNEVYKLLSFHDNWSDINQNGLPEFAVQYQYCPNACVRAAISVHFYEIQSNSSVIDLTADLPGVMEPFSMIYSESPLSFYIYDPTLWYSKWSLIETGWIYAWDGAKLVDVTPNYADEYIAKGEKITASIQEKYGDAFYEWELLTILFLYEKAGVRDLAIDTFLEVSQPSNWPNANTEEVCWLQVARATAVDDYKNGRPFQLPSIQVADAPADLHFQFANSFNPVFEVSDYDISACDEFMP